MAGRPPWRAELGLSERVRILVDTLPPSGGRLESDRERFFDVSLDLCTISTFDGYLRRVNPAVKRALGYSPHELASRPLLEFVHPDDAQLVTDRLGVLRSGQGVAGFVHRMICADGSVRWIEWNMRGSPAEGLVYGIGRDITERRRAEAELRRATREAEASLDELRLLADEQAALRRVAALIARESSPEDVLSKVAEEVSLLLGADAAVIHRYEPAGDATVVGRWGDLGPAFRVGSRSKLDGVNVTALVYRTERPVRLDDYEKATGSISEEARELRLRSAVGCPIVVDGQVWGAIGVATSRTEPMPPDTESRIVDFTKLVATAISNVEAREEVQWLVAEQAALRRVATLVATGAPSAEVFAKVAEEAAMTIGGVDCALCRDEGDGTITNLATYGDGMLGTLRIGERFPIDGTGIVARVLTDRRPCRIDDYSTTTGTMAERGRQGGIRSAAGCPIVAGGRLWGAIAIAKYDATPLPAAADRRIAQFADLAATAIVNAAARAEVERLLAEQASLRRVATLVAKGGSPGEVFDAVAEAMHQVLGADGSTLSRYERDEEVTVLAHRGRDAERVPHGTRVSHTDGESVISKVWRTGRPARFVHSAGASGGVHALALRMDVQSAVGAPIVLDGRLWGAIIAYWRTDQSVPSGTEERMAKFAELLDTAIANADGHERLMASRARLLTEADNARRRVVRDLHDGAQQRLVHTILTLKQAQRALKGNDDEVASLIAVALERAQQGHAELRELAHGLLPAVLTQGGLRAGVKTIVSRIDLPVEVDIPAERLPAEIEASAYFLVAEALTNVVKHSHAARAEVRARVQDATLRVEIRDDGVGGADPNGHGLVGLADRLTALGGQLKVASAATGGTLLIATLPIPTN